MIACECVAKEFIDVLVQTVFLSAHGQVSKVQDRDRRSTLASRPPHVAQTFQGRAGRNHGKSTQTKGVKMTRAKTVSVTVRRVALGWQWTVDDLGIVVKRGYGRTKNAAELLGGKVRDEYYRRLANESQG